MRTRALLSYILIFPLLMLAAQDKEFPEEEKQLEWAAVEGAAYYLVEIESEGVILYSIKTDEPPLPLFLNPGEYSIRISVFNKFEKIASRSEWNPLIIYPNPQPIIEGAEPSLFYDDEESITLSITGSDFDVNCRYYLVNGKDRVRGYEDSRTTEGNSVQADVTFSDTLMGEIGIWDIVVINPSNKEFVRESAVRFGPRVKPVINSMEPDVFFRGENPGEVHLRGEHFSPHARLVIEGPSDATYRNLEIYYAVEISFYLNPDELAEGEYTLAVENEGNVISNSIPFTVEAEEITLEEKIQEKRKSTSIFLGGSYHMSLPMDKSSDLFENSFLGFSLRARKKFNNTGIFRIPVLRQTGFAAGLHYTQYNDAIADYLTMSKFDLDNSLFYLSDWDFFLDIYVSIGFGASYSLYFFENGRFVNSLDFSDRIEFGLHYQKKKLTYELGYAMVFTHFTSNTMTALNPYLLIGWDF